MYLYYTLVYVYTEDVIAFGDGENDLEMLRLVTYGVAMDNGRDELKRVAYHVGLSNDKYGVAVILESMLK